MHYILLWQILSSALLVFAAVKRDPPSPQFVGTAGDHFTVNGSAFKFIGANAYWLHALNSDEDIENTLVNMSASGIRVVRTWAFNDVDSIPDNGTWFQLIANGTTTINNGTNGLPRLDKVVELAEKHGMYLQLVLTNNWNPRPLDDGLNLTDTVGAFGLSPRDVTPDTNNSLPRNTLSNDYGGMDLYVRQIGESREHDQFYVNATIISAFLNYTDAVVTRYVNSPAVFGWELANDPRCNSSLPAPSCATQDVTRWHFIVAQHVSNIDPNHLITSGNQGFFCASCQKLFFNRSPPTSPPPQTSPVPGVRRRKLPEPLTRAKLLNERKLYRKKWRAMSQPSTAKGGVRVRGRWVSTPTRRQDPEDDIGIGPAFDGAHGVDSEDILSISQIGYSTFQLFPDQNSYGLDSPFLSPFNSTVQEGLDWITRQVTTAQAFGKPISLTGFGLVTQGNAPSFVPFNSSVAPFAADNTTTNPNTVPFGVTDAQRDDAYQQWISAGILGGIDGLILYQWGQANLTTQPGTAVAPLNTDSGVGPVQDTSGVSPNDGYSIEGIGQPDVVSALQQAAQQIAPDS